MMQSRVRMRALAGVLVVGLGLGCGGDSGPTPSDPSPIPGTLALAISPAADSVVAGSSASTTVLITRGGSFTGTVALVVEGSPTGVTATLGNASLASGTSNTSLSFAVDSSAAPGTYPITVRGTGTGVLASSTYTLTVTALPDPDPGFGVTLSDSTFTIQEGDSIATPVIIRRIGGFTGAVGLVVSGTPSNVRARVTPVTTTDTIASLGISVEVGVPVGTYPLVLTASDLGPREHTVDLTLVVTPKPSAGVLTITPSTIQVIQTQPGDPVVVKLARAAGVTGPAELSLNAINNGMSGTFTPNPMTGDSAVLVINTTLLTPAGSINGTIRASVGNTTTTADVLITTRNFIPPNFSVSLDSASGTVTAGSAITTPVTLSRTNFNGPINLTVTGAPAGMTATIAPTPNSADSAELSITTTTAVTPGIYPLTVTGVADSITGSRSASFSLTVNAPTAGGNVQWQFCDPARAPLWFATRAGTTGAWSVIASTPTAAGVSFSFPFAQAGQVAYVLSSNGGFDVHVHNALPSEISALAASECTNNSAPRTLNGTALNLIGPTRGVSVVGGGAMSLVPTGGSAFTLTGVRDGLIDVLAYQGVVEPTGIDRFDRLILRRDLNPADGSTLAPFDFGASSTEWLFRNGGAQFFEGFGTDSFTVSRAYITSNGNLGTYQVGAPSLDSVRSLAAIPAALRRPGDVHEMTATTIDPVAPRGIIAYTASLSSPTLTFGPTLGQPTIGVLSSAPVQLRTAANWQPELRTTVTAAFRQGNGASERRVTLHSSGAFFGGAGGYTFVVPDFSGAPGWNPTWMLQAGTLTNYDVSAMGVKVGPSPTPLSGVQLLTGSRRGTLTP